MMRVQLPIHIWIPILLLLNSLNHDALASPFKHSGFTGNLTLTTDYVGRGVTQTQGGAAIQGGLDWQHRSGISAGVWASNIDFTSEDQADDGADLELEYYVDYSLTPARDWALSFGVIRFTFPQTLDGVDYDWSEYGVKFRYAQSWGGSVTHSNDIFASGRRGNYFSLWYRVKLSSDLAVTTKFNSARLDPSIFGDSRYRYGSISVGKKFAFAELLLAYHVTDSRASAMFHNIADDRLVLSLTKNF